MSNLSARKKRPLKKFIQFGKNLPLPNSTWLNPALPAALFFFFLFERETGRLSHPLCRRVWLLSVISSKTVQRLWSIWPVMDFPLIFIVPCRRVSFFTCNEGWKKISFQSEVIGMNTPPHPSAHEFSPYQGSPPHPKILVTIQFRKKLPLPPNLTWPNPALP